MGWLSYTAVTPRASLQSDANKVLPTLTMGFCLSVTSLRLKRTGPSCLITVHAGLGNSILFFTWQNLFFRIEGGKAGREESRGQSSLGWISIIEIFAENRDKTGLFKRNLQAVHEHGKRSAASRSARGAWKIVLVALYIPSNILFFVAGFCLEIMLAIKVRNLLACRDVSPGVKIIRQIWFNMGLKPSKHDGLAALVELDSVDVAAVVEQRCHWVESRTYHLHHLVDVVGESGLLQWVQRAQCQNQIYSTLAYLALITVTHFYWLIENEDQPFPMLGTRTTTKTTTMKTTTTNLFDDILWKICKKNWWKLKKSLTECGKFHFASSTNKI